MKKINQTTNILFLVAIAFGIKAYLDKNIMLVFIAMFVAGMALFRFLLIKQAMQDSEDTSEGSLDHVMQYLKGDETLYAQMLVAYQKGKCDTLYDESDGILLYDHSTQTYLASAKNEAGAKDILYQLPQDYGMLIAHEEVFTKFAGELFAYEETLSFYHYQYTQKGKYKLPQSNLTFQMLTQQDLEVVKQHYSVDDLCNDTYIRKCIEDGMMGAYYEETLVGFIGIHESGAMGLLEVFEAYRGKHIAQTLEMAYINYLVDQNCSLIYTQVNVENEASQKLQEKLLLKRSETPNYWYFSKED